MAQQCPGFTVNGWRCAPTRRSTSSIRFSILFGCDETHRRPPPSSTKYNGIMWNGFRLHQSPISRFAFRPHRQKKNTLHFHYFGFSVRFDSILTVPCGGLSSWRNSSISRKRALVCFWLMEWRGIPRRSAIRFECQCNGDDDNLTTKFHCLRFNQPLSAVELQIFLQFSFARLINKT